MEASLRTSQARDWTQTANKDVGGYDGVEDVKASNHVSNVEAKDACSNQDCTYF